jgi:DNA-binding Lrp family transcriptional regulator
MPARRETQKYIEEELPYRILSDVYENSRSTLKEMGRKLDISYQIVGRLLKRLEEQYRIVYTLDLDEQALGFSEGRVITIKFGKAPNVDLLKEKFRKDIFVQDAYLATGDFDLLIYVVGLTSKDFQAWQFSLRKEFSEYVPTVKVSNLNEKQIGFFPIRDELIRESTVLNDVEKRILITLNGDSRIKLKDLVRRSNTTQMRAIYAIQKLKEKGVIRRFSALTQNPDKRLFACYTLAITPIKEHNKLFLEFAKEVVAEGSREIVNDYAFWSECQGSIDALVLCSFANGEVMAKRGPNLIERLWSAESPKIEKAMLTGIIVGKWPFHLEGYEKFNELIKKLNPTKS